MNGFIHTSSAMDYDPSILIVSQQSVWPAKQDPTNNMSFNYNSQVPSSRSSNTKDSTSYIPIFDTSNGMNNLSASQYSKGHPRTFNSSNEPSNFSSSMSSASHIHCSLQGNSQASNKSTGFHVPQQTDNSRTSNSRDESPMVVVQVTDG